MSNQSSAARQYYVDQLDEEQFQDSAAAPVQAYFETLRLLERLHRLLLDLVKDEFERLGQADLTPIQGLLIFNLGHQQVTAGELRSRGMYQGSNVSYNLKKLVDMGYVHHKRCDMDRRSVRVSLTPQGDAVRAIIENMFMRHAELLNMAGVLSDPPIEEVNRQTRQIERVWSEQIRYIY